MLSKLRKCNRKPYSKLEKNMNEKEYTETKKKQIKSKLKEST
jgi:hypothetical protein